MTEAAGLRASSPRGLSAALRGYLTDLATELRLSMLGHRWLLGLVFGYWLAGIVVAYYANMPTGATIETYLPIYMEMMPGMLLTLVDRKSTRLNSSHSQISYAVFCLK